MLTKQSSNFDKSDTELNLQVHDAVRDSYTRKTHTRLQR